MSTPRSRQPPDTDWMLGQPLLWVYADEWGHVCVEAVTRRIWITRLADPTRVDPWTHAHIQRRLREYAVGRTH